MAANALVLAGRTDTDSLRSFTDASSKALVDINGKPMIHYVLTALRQSGRIGRIVVVGPTQELRNSVAEHQAELLDDGSSIIENIKIGARRLPADERMLIATSDIPLLTAPVVDAFLGLCDARQADLYYPIVEKSVNERKYPLVKRTYVALQEGVFTGGNVFVVEPWIVEPVAPKVENFIANRKNPLALARLLGPVFILKLLLKLLTIPELEAKISSLWGIRGAAVVCPHPEIGIDVDKPSDLQLVRAALK